MSSTPQLLAPAGDFESLRAAVANGADAVYFGLSNFNARHRATNFTVEQLPEVMDYLHAHNVRGYVALNTLIFSNELNDVVQLIQSIAQAGPDAVIVQDLGLAELIHQICPTLELHASTQMTLTDPRGIHFAEDLGIRRVILARELSLPQIAHIAAEVSIPLEVFVHGALCVAYSGQCLTSESIGGRSANRGQCAQACRLPYELIVDGQVRSLGDRAYLLSPKDLAAHERIADLLHAGVQALKIEGRLKSAHYVAATTQTYRAALDAALAHQPLNLSPQQQQDLAQSFSRGFSQGFFDGPNHQTLVHARFPKSRGIHIGTVTQKTPTSLFIALSTQHPALSTPLKPGDGIVFDEGHPEQDEQGGRIYSVNVARGTGAPPVSETFSTGGAPALRKSPPTCLEVTFGRGEVNLSAVALGALVWKTDDPAIRKRLEHSYSRDRVLRPLALTASIEARIDQVLRITVRDPDGHETAVQSDQPLAAAQKHPLTEELFREQFGRLGNTPFVLDSVQWLAREPVMAPKSLLNDLRRQAVQQLLEQRQIRHPIAHPKALDTLRQQIPSSGHASHEPRLYILCRTLPQLQTILRWKDSAHLPPAMIYCDFEDIRQYPSAVQQAHAANIPVALATLRILKPQEDGLLRSLAAANPDAILVRNLSSLSFFRQEHPSLPLIADYSLNIANELTAAIIARSGAQRLVPSYDLDWNQLTALVGGFDPSRLEIVLHQHMPMFHMEHCVFAHTLSTGRDHRTCGRPCDRHRVELKDRVGVCHPLLADAACRNTVFSGTVHSAAQLIPQMKLLGLCHFRIELLREDPDQTVELLNRYARLLETENPPTPGQDLLAFTSLPFGPPDPGRTPPRSPRRSPVPPRHNP